MISASVIVSFSLCRKETPETFNQMYNYQKSLIEEPFNNEIKDKLNQLLYEMHHGIEFGFGYFTIKLYKNPKIISDSLYFKTHFGNNVSPKEWVRFLMKKISTGKFYIKKATFGDPRKSGSNDRKEITFEDFIKFLRLVPRKNIENQKTRGLTIFSIK